MRPYEDPLQPVAVPGEAVRLEPSNTVYRVKAVEQMARVGPVDYGSITAGSSAEENSSTIIDLEDELEMNDRHIGQFVINPLSLVEIEIRQTGNQDQRFVNKNQVGKITPYSPINQRLIWVWEDSGIQAILSNNQTWDMAKSLVYYTGFKLQLEDSPMSEQEANRMRGEPASIPVDSLKKTPQEATK